MFCVMFLDAQHRMRMTFQSRPLRAKFAYRHREHSQRRSAPVSRGQRRSDFSDSVD